MAGSLVSHGRPLLKTERRTTILTGDRPRSKTCDDRRVRAPGANADEPYTSETVPDGRAQLGKGSGTRRNATWFFDQPTRFLGHGEKRVTDSLRGARSTSIRPVQEC